MGVMKVVLHPPLVVGDERSSSERIDFKRFLHARLWLDIELSNRIEELAVEDATAAVRRAEFGLLLVAGGVDLAVRGARDLMID